jgi:hypothetical protein
MKTIRLFTPLTRGFVVLGLALGLLLSGPIAASAAPAADGGGVSCAATYVVQTGDTLSVIGGLYNMSWVNIARANGLGAPYVLYPGESLCIPANSTAPNTAPATATRLRFLTGSTGMSAGLAMPAGQTWYYVFRAAQGQPAIVDVMSFNGDATFSLTAPGGAAVVSAAEKRATWQGTLPATGDYMLAIYGGASAENVSLSLTIAARLEFAPGATQITLPGRTAGGYAVTYAAWARQGQVMTVDVTGAGTNAALTVWGFSDGQPYIRDVVEQTHFSFTLPSSQDYIIMVVPRAGAVVNYTLSVKIN